MKKLGFFTALLFIIALTGCSSETKDPVISAFNGQSAKQIFDQGEQSLAKKSYKDAIKNFEALAALYPYSTYQEQSQLELIYAYYMDKDYESVIDAGDRFTRLYPQSKNLDYIYYLEGLANFSVDRAFGFRFVDVDLSQRDLSKTKTSFSDFAKVVNNYPSSPYAPAARARMVYLRNLLAKQQLDIAKYYFERKSYVAAINRANMVVQHYQQSPSVIPALAILAQSYHALHLDNQAKQITDILAMNYPNSPEYTQTKKMLTH